MKINNNQKNILLLVAGIIVLMFVFPPYKIELTGNRKINQGYAFIVDGPTNINATINIGQLLMQWFGVIVVGGIVFISQKD